MYNSTNTNEKINNLESKIVDLNRKIYELDKEVKTLKDKLYKGKEDSHRRYSNIYSINKYLNK